MMTSCRCCKTSCTVIAIVTSLIIGIITSFLRITATITLTPAFLWVLLGIAVGYLAIVLISGAIFRKDKECCNDLCAIINTLLVGVLGTTLLSIVLLAIEFVATSIIGSILAGGLLFFFFLVLTSTACLVRCFINCND